MYRNILVPMALSREKGARTAVKVAEQLLSEGGSITALHIMETIPPYVARFLPEGNEEKRRAETMAMLSEQVAGHEAVTPVVVDGHAGRGITEYAEAHDADLIVVASHRPGPADLLLGSTASYVVRHAACAVHVTR